MTAYESIRDKLLPLSIYNIMPDGLIEAEVRAYAVGLQGLYDAVDEAIRECFVQTAESWGLTSLELMTRTYESGDEIEDRRKKLLTKLSIKPTDIGVDGLKKVVASLGLECDITENDSASKVYVNVTTDVDESKQAFIETEIKRFTPQHLLMYVTFNNE